MFNRRPQHLSEAVAGLISTIVGMMLGLLRARGLRGLLELPTLFRFVRDLRRLAEEFSTLFAAFKAGTRTPVAPAPEPAPQEWQPAPARATRTPRVAARPDPEDRARHRQAAPAADPEPDRARAEPAPSQ